MLIMLIIDTDSSTTGTTKKHTARAMCITIALFINAVLKDAQEKSHAEFALRVVILVLAKQVCSIAFLLSVNKAIKC